MPTQLRRRLINFFGWANDLFTGISVMVTGYYEDWQHACAFMVAGFILNKIKDLLKSDSKEIIESTNKNTNRNDKTGSNQNNSEN